MTRSEKGVLSVILYFVSDPESESVSEPELESIRSPESEPESESEQPYHDSAPLKDILLTTRGRHCISHYLVSKS